MAKEPHNRRQRFFVYRSVQSRVLRRITGYWIAYHVFLWHAMFLSDGLRGGAAAQLSERYADFFWSNLLFILCAICVFPIFFIDTLKFTHRIVGPLIRLEGVMKQMILGKRVPPIELRDKDLLTDYCAAFNELLATHNERIQARPCDFPSIAADSTEVQSVAAGELATATDARTPGGCS